LVVCKMKTWILYYVFKFSSQGCTCSSLAERRIYFEIARGSVIEVGTAFDIAEQLQYVKLKSIERLGELIISCFKQLTGMMSARSE
jgi:four helix bundle protein